MLQEQSNELGIQFTEDPPLVRRSPFINPSVLLPQLIEHLHLPPFPQEHLSFLQIEQVNRRIREQDRPICEFPGPLPDRSISSQRLRFQIGASPLSHFLGDADDEQAHEIAVLIGYSNDIPQIRDIQTPCRQWFLFEGARPITRTPMRELWPLQTSSF